MKINYKNKEAGLTLIETMVSFLILTLAIVGSYTLIRRNISNSVILKNELVAAQLVEEGIEVARNLRDSDWHAGRTFGASIPNGAYRVQWNSTSLLADGSLPLKLDSATGIYSYDSGTDTLFRRTMAISINPGEDAIKRIVAVTISWTERGVAKSVQAEEHLYNWK